MENPTKATGTFEVKLSPLDTHATATDGINLGRLSIEKTFHGDLEATSSGEMLAARTPVEGSAGYVAMEQVSGQLAGKTGTFVFQHFGIMSGGTNRLVLEVVPDSATGELVGLSGAMSIEIDDGQHRYVFEYVMGRKA